MGSFFSRPPSFLLPDLSEAEPEMQRLAHGSASPALSFEQVLTLPLEHVASYK
jgi:hypothetical protein